MYNETLFFNFHGVLTKVIVNDKESTTFINTDFSYFIIKSTEHLPEPDFIIRVLLGRPPFEIIPEYALASFNTKDAVIYRRGKLTYYDYFGEALVVYDDVRQSAEIYSTNRDFLYEKTYLMIMSRIGLALDKRKLHRVHAMGMACAGKGILCLLPMGGGKTTLALSLLKHESFSLLSEEIPLVSAKGRLHPMPIRMGVRVGTALDIPNKYLKPFNRSHYEPKVLIDTAYFHDQIASIAEPGFVFLGRRRNSARPKIVRTSRLKTFNALFRSCVMGVGVPQLLEYVLRFDLPSLFGSLEIFVSRIRASLALCFRSETYEIYLSRNLSANADFLYDFVLKKLGNKRAEMDGRAQK
jgi:hypothetical protein